MALDESNTSDPNHSCLDVAECVGSVAVRSSRCAVRIVLSWRFRLVGRGRWEWTELPMKCRGQKWPGEGETAIVLASVMVLLLFL